MDKFDQNKGSAPETTSDVYCPPKHRTVGNIVYDFGVFGSIAWGGVAALSAISAHEAQHGSNKYFGWLRALNNGVSSGLTNVLSKTFKKMPMEQVKGYARGTTMFLTLGMGGNALMAPIKWMEDNRQKNAARIDNILGTTPPDPSTIEHEPKQTWKSVFSGRMISWGSSYLAFLAMGPKLTGKISNWFGDKATKVWMSKKPTSNPETVRRWADIAAFDALFTVITASLTYLSSRTIARHDEEVHEQEIRHHSYDPATMVRQDEDIPQISHASRHASHRQNPEKPEYAKMVRQAQEMPASLTL